MVAVTHFDYLLQYLACPVDGSAVLTVIRDQEDTIVALRSSNGEYPVAGNVPCMIPDLGSGRRPAWKRWESLLEKWMQAFGSEIEPESLAESDPVAGYIGEMMSGYGTGLCLDVGCGTSPWTPYMDACSNELNWIGIDPIIGNPTRRFPFVQGLGEYLPFKSGIFDGALYSLVLSNMMDPLQSMRQARRVLKPDGRVYVRYYVTRIDVRYLLWLTMRTLRLPWRYNQFYQWVYTNQSLQALLHKAGFAIERRILLCGICPHSNQCPDSGSEFFVIGQPI
jgi:SAM-dependent methyltransferase